jgi:hypothetical protein
MGHLSREIVAAMELVVEAECLELPNWRQVEYVADNLLERFPEMGFTTAVVLATEIVKTRHRGLW